MNRSREMEKYLMPLLPEEPEEITATALQREYKNGYLDGQKKAYDECGDCIRQIIAEDEERIQVEERKKIIAEILSKLKPCVNETIRTMDIKHVFDIVEILANYEKEVR